MTMATVDSGTQEPRPEAIAEDGVPEPEGGSPSVPELLLPCLVCLVVITVGLVVVTVWTRKRTRSLVAHFKTSSGGEVKNSDSGHHDLTTGHSDDFSRIKVFSTGEKRPSFFAEVSADSGHQKNKDDNTSMDESIPTRHSCLPPLFSSQDLQALDDLDKRWSADIWELFYILLPVLVSLGLCPMTLHLHSGIVSLFWPARKSPPDINDAISCFLVPAGMVYAIFIGFAFQEVAAGFRETEISILKQVDQLKTVLKLIDDLRVVPPLHRVTMVRIVKDVTLETILRLRGHTAHTGHDTQRQSEGNLWGKSLGDIVRVAYSSAKVKDGDMWQSALLRRLEKRVAHDDDIFFKLFLKRRIHALQWAFLEALGYFTFLGMLLVRCESYRAELAMCLITVISISLLCYLVADLDSPFHGFFRVDLHCYDEVTSLLGDVFVRAVPAGLAQESNTKTAEL